VSTIVYALAPYRMAFYKRPQKEMEVSQMCTGLRVHSQTLIDLLKSQAVSCELRSMQELKIDSMKLWL
jgi:hypothetical protein